MKIGVHQGGTWRTWRRSGSTKVEPGGDLGAPIWDLMEIQLHQDGTWRTWRFVVTKVKSGRGWGTKVGSGGYLRTPRCVLEEIWGHQGGT